MKIFISQPIRERTETEIERVRENIKSLVESHFSCPDEVIYWEYNDIEKVKDEPPVKALVYSIIELTDSQLAVFTEDWYKARECDVEHKICNEYGIPNIEVNKEGTAFSEEGWRYDDNKEW